MKYLFIALLFISLSGFAQNHNSKDSAVTIQHMINSTGVLKYPDILIDGIFVSRSKFSAFNMPPAYIRKVRFKDSILVIHTKLPYEVDGKLLSAKDRAPLKNIRNNTIDSVIYIPANEPGKAGFIKIKRSN